MYSMTLWQTLPLKTIESRSYKTLETVTMPNQIPRKSTSDEKDVVLFCFKSNLRTSTVIQQKAGPFGTTHALRVLSRCPKGLLCRDLSNFVVRPSSVVRPSVRLSHSVLDRDFAKDACQELDSRSKPGPFGTFCKTSPYGRQSGCRT